MAALLLFFTGARAAEVGLVFIAESGKGAEQSAIFKGVRDACADAEKKYGKKISAKMLYPDRTATQSILLDQAFLEGARAAVICPDISAATKLAQSAQTLAKKDFYTAAVGASAANFPIKICTDEDAVLKKIADTLLPMRAAMNFKALSLSPVRADEDAPFSAELSKKIAAQICGGENDTSEMFSVYAKRNAPKLAAYDNYALILLSAQILADARPLPEDPDRLCAIVLGAIAQLDAGFSKNGITLCIAPDYYGYGYVAARTALDMIFEAKTQKTEIKLPPKFYKYTDADLFKREWAEYIGSAN